MKAPVLGTYSAVTSTLALLVAVGGTSYAATQLTGHDIKNGTVTAKDVKNRTLTMKDLSPMTRKKLTGAAGPVGPVGPAGPPGPVSPSHVLQVTNPDSVVMSGQRQVVLTVDLPAGSYLVESTSTGFASDSTSILGCKLSTSLVTDTGIVQGDGLGKVSTLRNQLVFTATASTSVTLSCLGTTFTLTRETLTAMSVGSTTDVRPPEGP